MKERNDGMEQKREKWGGMLTKNGGSLEIIKKKGNTIKALNWFAA